MGVIFDAGGEPMKVDGDQDHQNPEYESRTCVQQIAGHVVALRCHIADLHVGEPTCQCMLGGLLDGRLLHIRLIGGHPT